MSGQRKRKFMSQLPDTLQLLAGSMRAGYSLMQGVDTVAQEVDDPMGRELRRVLAEARLGRVLEDSLEDMANRLGSADFEWAVMAIRIQREVGGNLAELLSTVAETMIARERLRREVRALTAEGRISALILGLLPVGLGVIMYGINPEYVKVLFNDGLGQVLLIGAAVLAIIGFYWMKKTIDIEI
jgi:tight adherence protein B